METYIIKVNGETYEVEVEKKENSASGKSVAVKRETAEKIETSGCPVKTEMAGKVWKITAPIGQAVKKGDTVMILEVMKLEVPVSAPSEGVVRSIAVSEGDPVTQGQTVAVVA